MSNRLASYMLAVCSLLMIAAISMHPTVKAKHAADVLRGAVAIAPMDRGIHAGVIVMALVMLVALAAYTVQRLGLTTLAAIVTYGFGAGAIVCAALIDGFFVPGFAQRSLAVTGAGQSEVITVLVAAAVAIQVATKVGLIAMCAATVLWSADLIVQNGTLKRIAGGLGILAGTGAAALSLLSGHLNPHSLMVIVGVQALWYLAMARVMYEANAGA